MKKKIPVGMDSFEDIRSNGFCYVDKTKMIVDFISLQNKVSLITRPRRFGKTLNMSMLSEFFDITKNSNELFAGLEIMNSEYANRLNSVPVISLTFKNCSASTAEGMKHSLADSLIMEYMRYDDLLSPFVDKEHNDYFHFFKILTLLKKGELPDNLLESSLMILTRAVSSFYNKKVLLLIDEYDQPLIKAHEKGFRDSFSSLYGNFLSQSLKGNPYLEQALLTGIQRVVKESIFSGLNNFIVYTVMDEMYASYFGLTTQETSEVLEYYDLELTEDVKKYYNGYLFSGLEIYNPWSILNYIMKKHLRAYWINTSTNALIKDSIAKADKDFLEDFEELILDGEVEVSANLETSFIELADKNSLWGLLVNSGYLTVTKEYLGNYIRLRIPNMEVKEEFRQIVASYTRLNENRLNEMFNCLFNAKMDKFLKVYQKLVYDYVSVYDIKENGYHMLFLGMAISVSGFYDISSNIESGDGRPDIVLKSLQPEVRPHIIIEFKQGENLEKLKSEALEQIFDKNYFAKLSGEVLCVGIAHNKKNCELAYKEIMV